MTVLFNSDLESYTNGQSITGWALAQGSGMQATQTSIVSMASVSGTMSYGRNSVSDTAVYTASGVLTDQAVRTDHMDLVSSTGPVFVGGVLRSNSSATSAYRTYVETNGTSLRVTIAAYASGSTVLASSGYTFTCVGTDVVHFESKVVGSVLEARIWKNSAARPSTPTVTATDSTFASGYPGLRNASSSNVYAFADNIVITDGAGGEGYYDPASGVTISTTPGNNTAAGYASTVTNGAAGLIVSTTPRTNTAAGLAATLTNYLQTGIIPNNTGSIYASTAVVWTWTPAGRVGSMVGLTPQDGTGTTDSNGRLVVPLNAATGRLSVAVRNASAATDDIFEQYFG